MLDPSGLIEYSIAPESVRDIDRLERHLVSFNPLTNAGFQVGIYRVAAELAALIKDEFRPHDESGRANDRTQWGTPYYEGYVHTLDTMDITHYPGGARISMAGGAPYIEFGTSEHYVGPRDTGDPTRPGVLHWMLGGEHYFSQGHDVSGITEDDFVGRAMSKLDLQALLGGLFTFSHTTATGG